MSTSSSSNCGGVGSCDGGSGGLWYLKIILQILKTTDLKALTACASVRVTPLVGGENYKCHKQVNLTSIQPSTTTIILPMYIMKYQTCIKNTNINRYQYWMSP